MNGKGSALAVGCVGRSIVERLAVMERYAPSGQFNGYGLGLIDLVTHVK